MWLEQALRARGKYFGNYFLIIVSINFFAAPPKPLVHPLAFEVHYVTPESVRYKKFITLLQNLSGTKYTEKQLDAKCLLFCLHATRM
jgi:hypothetical protein